MFVCEVALMAYTWNLFFVYFLTERVVGVLILLLFAFLSCFQRHTSLAIVNFCCSVFVNNKQ